MKLFLDYKKLFSLIFLVVYLLTPVSFSVAQTVSDIQNKISQKDSDIQQLEKEIAVYQTQLNSLGQQKNSLSTSLKELDDLIAKPTTTNPDRKYYIALSISLLMLGLGVIGLFYTFYYGIGMWGNNIPVAWAFDFTNFVFWVGIGHAGTLISAILFLLRQKWRTGISRFAEGMTIFAVMTAGIFPIIHLGRPWLAGYLFPYPNQHALWVNFTSPLVWDVFAVSTYFTVSLIFWFVGLIPDLAVLRERTVNKVKKIIYSIFSLGWRFSSRHWQHYEMVYLILAGFATPLVLSVHTIVSFDFAVSILP